MVVAGGGAGGAMVESGWRWCRRLSCIRIWTKSIQGCALELSLGSYSITVGAGGAGGALAGTIRCM